MYILAVDLLVSILIDVPVSINLKCNFFPPLLLLLLQMPYIRRHLPPKLLDFILILQGRYQHLVSTLPGPVA